MDNGSFNLPIKPVGLIRSTQTNSGFVFAPSNYNVDSGRFNSIGQTSTSSSDISSGSENFRLKCRNDWSKYENNVSVYKNSSELNHAIATKTSPKQVKRASVAAKNCEPIFTKTSNERELNRLPSSANRRQQQQQQIWLQHKSNNGNTVM